MERSVIRERTIPDYAALHPGYRATTSFALYKPFPKSIGFHSFVITEDRDGLQGQGSNSMTTQKTHAEARATALPRVESAGLREARRRIEVAARQKDKDLDLSRLGLTEIPLELHALTGLTSLNLWGNQIGADGARALAALTSLTSLDLSRNGIGDDGARALAALTGLTSLNLSDNEIGNDGARALAALTGLTSLYLWGNRIGADGARALAALTGLTSLDLSANEVGADGARALAALTGLTSLDLSFNGIGADGARALAGLTGLTSLKLSANEVGADGARALAALTGLTSLDLLSNQISDDGVRALAALTGLTSLDLSSNQISDDGARALAALTGLTSLDLSENQIGDDGARALAALTGLTSLNLRRNQIGADGARALAVLTGLTSLDLWGNQIGADGARALAALTGLTSLHLWKNQIGADGVRALAALTGLTSLDLSDNQIGADGARALAALTGLTSLDLAGSGAEDLSPLMNLIGLKRLDCSGCRLTAPVPAIWTLPSIEELILYEAVLPGVPTEVLSPYPGTSCLESLRAHFNDLEDGESEVAEIKFMILGNGRVGKTQICRRLQGKDYDDTLPSTHGIEVNSASLALPGAETITLKIWDFGGQDIYHGTHALFLKSSALFPLIWMPESEAAKEHEHGGFTFRNQPLGYWLAYVRTFGGPSSPVLVIQSQCDEPEQEWLSPPVPQGALDVFPFRKLLHYSALNDRGRAALDEALADAVRWLRRQRGVDKIGSGRAEVKSRLESMYAAGKRLITQNEFLALCQDVSRDGGKISSPQFLLEFLHNSGAVFYRRGLFGDAIILDQAWALKAVYAVFDRNSKAFRNIERYGGRFRRSDLAQWVWQEHGEAEQKLFISFMGQCGICFVIRRGGRDIEAEYIAPDLLPRRDAPEIALELRQKWDDGCDTEATLAYDLLPPGLMRSLISKIGDEAGLAAEYWRDGFYFYDERTGSKALVEQRWTEGWSGEIRVQTQRGQAELLLNRVLELIDAQHDALGARPSARGATAQVAKQAAKMEAREGEGHPVAIKPAHEPSTKTEYLVSYAWGDDTQDGREREAVVNRFCDAATAKGRVVIRDKTAMRPGDRISKFMERIGRGDRVFVFLSDKYLKSTYCMSELFDVWRNCREEDSAFIKRTRIYVLPCAKIATLPERTQYVLHWRAKFDEMDALVKAYGPGILAAADLTDYRRMETFVGKTPDMLRLVQDVLRPRKFEEFVEYGFNDPPKVEC